MSKVVERELAIVNRRGLHARAAARLVKLAGTFESEITVARDGAEVSGLSIMGLMMLAAAPGTTITVRAAGREAEQALEAIEALVCCGFDED